MLQGSFYTVQELRQPAAAEVHATIVLNPAHSIFDGHFPGLPVVPGVCMLQIIKECLEAVLQQKLTLTKAGNIKFLTVLTPKEHGIVDVRITFESSENSILVTEASILSGTTRFIRMQQGRYAQRPS